MISVNKRKTNRQKWCTEFIKLLEQTRPLITNKIFWKSHVLPKYRAGLTPGEAVISYIKFFGAFVTEEDHFNLFGK
jgi:hypothetical protein